MKGSAGERIAIVLICFGYLSAVSVIGVVKEWRHYEYDNAAVADTMGLEIAFGLAAALVLRRRGWARGDFGFKITFGSSVAAVGLIVLTTIAYRAAYAVLAATGALTGWTELEVKDTAAPAVMLLFLIVNSVFEEVFVVGYLVEAARPSGMAFAVSLSTMVRLLYHTYQGPVALASIVPLGLIFGAVYARYRNLWPLILAHTLVNIYAWVTA